MAAESYSQKAKRIRKVVEEAAASLTDQTASIAPEIYPRLTYSGEAIQAGTRINWRGVVKKANVTLWDREDQDPEHAPDLWDDLQYKEGIRIIPSTLYASDAFQEGELGWWQDVLYVSLISSNVWTPEAYPAGWKEVV